jgi:hypothetical protein
MSNPFDREDDIPQLQELPTSIAPGAGVEDAVVAALYAGGILRRRRAARTWLVVAAMIAAFAGGIWIGRSTAPAPREQLAPSTAQSMPASPAPGTTVIWF